jgi:RHS repeat-associated protein
VRQHFTGYEADGETGLNYAQARYQSPAQGRFTSVDPLGASASIGDPQSFNRYSYVGDNPTNLTDPTGMIPYNGADQSWGDVANGFWGSGYLGGNGWGNDPSPGRTIVNANFQSDVRLVQRYRSVQYSDTADADDPDGNFTEHVKFWWEKAWERFDFQQNETSSWDPFGKNVGRDSTIFGTLAGIGERMNTRPGYWRGLNGQWFRISSKFWGNQHTGSKLDALLRGKAFRLTGRFLFFAGAANTAYQYRNGNISGTKACFDLCFSAAGTFGGPPGMAANAVYSGVDMTVGWPRVGQEMQKSFSDPDTRQAIISQWQ